MMQTIPLTLTLEFWRRRRLWIVTAPVAMAILPMLVYSVLKLDGLPSMEATELGRRLFTAFFAVSLIYISTGVLGFSRDIEQHYVLPISARFLVGWKMLNGIACAALVYLGLALLLNVAFGAGWPLWGPALIASMTFVSAQAIVWALRNSVALQLMAGAGFTVGIGLWAAAKYETGIAEGVTAGINWGLAAVETLTIAALMAAVYLLASAGVVRDRRGDGVNLAWLKSRVEAFFEMVQVERTEAFSSAGSAQMWLEWNCRGQAYPILAAIAATVAIVLCISPWIEAEAGLGIVAGLSVVLLMVSPLVGMFIGHRSEDFELDSFVATRPISDAQLANVVLKNATLSVLAASAVWAAGASIVVGWFVITGHLEALADAWRESHLTKFAGAISVPVLIAGGFLATWTVTALGASLALARKWLAISFVQVAVLASISFIFLNRFVVPASVQPMLASAVLYFLGIGCVAGTGWAFACCRRKGFVSVKIIWSAFVLWSVVALAMTIAVRFPSPTLPLQGLIALIGLSTLPFVSMAAAPLALCWNRHR